MRKFIILSACIAVFTGCNSLPYESLSSYQEEKLNTSYTICLPKTYTGIGYFKGEDTKGFKKYAQDKKVYLFFEDGHGTDFQQMTYTKAVLPKKVLEYTSRKKIINKNRELIGWLYLKTNDKATLRNQVGTLLILEENSFKEVLHVQFAPDREEEVKLLMSTIILK